MNNRLLIAILIAALLWFFMFSPWTAGLMNFWIAMGVSAIILVSICRFTVKDFYKQFEINTKGVVIGIVSAAVLYGVFYIGNYLSTAWFDFAKPQIGNIYGMKEGSNLWLIGLLLLVVVGPAEEIFWRGFVQRALTVKYGNWVAFFVTTLIYALVHIWSFNFMLIMAALVCGAFWGLMFIYFGKKSIVPLIISHALWDVAVFVVFPIM
ncbi:MAG: CAAX protease family protein [Bacteroidales bacterium 36-12]|jgi:membrane protease YdiL (CAAX protease family)|nr:MAG: CAAX protease family protein [Bacteroidales bacterium 36-12]